VQRRRPRRSVEAERPWPGGGEWRALDGLQGRIACD
jgi:hypothetical protein